MKIPGKLILSGEHAVVYGVPAIAVSVNRFAESTVSRKDDGMIRIDAPQFCRTVNMPLSDAYGLRDELDRNYREFCAGERRIKDVLGAPDELLVYAVVCALQECGPCDDVEGVTVHVKTDIPVGCGMGSSAAVAASIIGEVAAACGGALSQQRLFDLTMSCEQLQHGHPSGVDAYVSVYGGCVEYTKGDGITPVLIDNMQLVLINTGEPQSSTGECVERVRKEFADNDIWREFGEVVTMVKEGMMSHRTDLLRDGVRRNHALLCRIGVVPEKIQHLIEKIEELGGAAKICGAGSVAGDAGGMVWVTDVAENELKVFSGLDCVSVLSENWGE